MPSGTVLPTMGWRETYWLSSGTISFSMEAGPCCGPYRLTTLPLRSTCGKYVKTKLAQTSASWFSGGLSQRHRACSWPPRASASLGQSAAWAALAGQSAALFVHMGEHEELGKVPLDVVTQELALLRLHVAPHGVGVEAVDVHLGKHREGGAILVGERADLCSRAWLLPAELVAREGEDHEPGEKVRVRVRARVGLGRPHLSPFTLTLRDPDPDPGPKPNPTTNPRGARLS